MLVEYTYTLKVVGGKRGGLSTHTGCVCVCVQFPAPDLVECIYIHWCSTNNVGG